MLLHATLAVILQSVAAPVINALIAAIAWDAVKRSGKYYRLIDQEC
jgi:hypothetical protein